MNVPVSPSNNDVVSPTNHSIALSPHTTDVKLTCHNETKRPQSQPSSPSGVVIERLLSKELVPEQEQEIQEVEGNQEHVELEELKETLLRKSTGSIAVLARQQEALDHRRHTFSTMSADSRANMRRRSYDLTMQFGSTFPPLSLQQTFSHSLKTHYHIQHLRVYGKSSGLVKPIGDCHEEGTSMVDLVSPSRETVWTRGKPVDVKWKVLDTNVSKLRIELLEDGLSATTLLAAEAPNTGFFTYHKVPWGMESGSKYFLRVSASDNLERYRTSYFFQISSAP